MGCHASFLAVGGSFSYNDTPAWEAGTSTVRVVSKRVLLCFEHFALTHEVDVYETVWS